MEQYEAIEAALNAGDLIKAQSLLDEMTERDGEWHYLQAAVFYKKRWYLEARKALKAALKADKKNEKYKKAYAELTEKIDEQAKINQATLDQEIKEKGKMNICEICCSGLSDGCWGC